MVNITHEKGAQVVIGFTDEAYCNEVNDWAEEFFTAMSNGCTVNEACLYVLDYLPTLAIVNLVHVAGSRDLTIN